jgi:hypothetical protein
LWLDKSHQPEESLAIELFTAQLSQLSAVRELDYTQPEFITWRDTVTELFQRFLHPDSPHSVTFQGIRFRGQAQLQPARRLPYSYRGPRPTSSGVSQENLDQFRKGCAIAEGCIRSAIETITNFGVYDQRAGREVSRQRGGIQQTFNAPVTIHNQALATDRAVQNIGQQGETGASLKEIAALLQTSMELRGREVQEGLKAVEDIASELPKPVEKRNWKFLLDSGEKLIGIAGKATDLTLKLAPYLQNIEQFVSEARKHIHL